MPWVSTLHDRPAQRADRASGRARAGAAASGSHRARGLRAPGGCEPRRRRSCRPLALRAEGSRRGPCWKPSATSAGPTGEDSAGSPSTFSSASRLIAPARTSSTSARQRRLDPGVIRRNERLQPAPAALDVQHGLASGQHHVRARDPGRARGSRRPGRPGQRRTVRLRRIDRGEHDRRVLVCPARPQPLDRARRANCAPPKPFDEVPAPRHAQRLQLRQLRDIEPRTRRAPPRRAPSRGSGSRSARAATRRSPAGAPTDRPSAGTATRSATSDPGPAPTRPRRDAGDANRPGRAAPRNRSRWARARVSRGARSGANASFVASPAQARSHSASCNSSGARSTSTSRSVKKHAPAPSRARTASCAGESSGAPLPLGGGANQIADLRGSTGRPGRNSAQRTGADPHDLARSAQLIDPRRRIRADASREDVALPHLGRHGQPLERHQHLAQAVDPGAGRRMAVDALPGGEEARQRAVVDRLYLLAQNGQRGPAQAPQHLGVAPFARRPARSQLTPDEVSGFVRARPVPRTRQRHTAREHRPR